MTNNFPEIHVQSFFNVKLNYFNKVAIKTSLPYVKSASHFYSFDLILETRIPLATFGVFHKFMLLNECDEHQVRETTSKMCLLVLSLEWKKKFFASRQFKASLELPFDISRSIIIRE